MAHLIDTAKCILEQGGEMTAMKLQKLMYYSQAWHLVWDERPLFNEDFEAWANGPVLPTLYQRHRGQFVVDVTLCSEGDTSRLTAEERRTVSKVLQFYGVQTAQWLSNLSHQERPWLEARGSAPDGDLCNTKISKASMHEYYSAL